MKLKRVIDLVLSGIFFPFFCVITILIGSLIKLNSRGPIFYRHSRIGKNGQPFKVLKFRTMYVDADKRLAQLLEKNPHLKDEWNKYFKLGNDSRITKVGKILRKTSLDELPQIINIVRGEMSLVGPRPVLAEELTNRYKDKATYYYQVQPGITGLWQVSGRNKIPYEKRVDLDVKYIKNLSFSLDLDILLKTIKVVLKQDGI